jgi:hypothetical protein
VERLEVKLAALADERQSAEELERQVTDLGLREPANGEEKERR